MPKLNRLDLYNRTIPAPDGLDDAMNGILGDEGFPRPLLKTTLNTPPLFLYTEERMERNLLMTVVYFGGRGQGAVVAGGRREVLAWASPPKIIRNAERGEILSALCQIEFCLDTFLCLHEGVFNGSTTWPQLRTKFESRDGDYATIDRKILSLRRAGLIRTTTKDLLMKAKQVRNVLAHQYLPEARLGLSETDAKQYSSLPEAIELTFNATWVELLTDYSSRQVPVANWIKAELDIRVN